MTYLEKAAAARADIENASAALRNRIDALLSADEIPSQDIELAAMLEVARSLRRSSDDLCLYLASEALDRGVPAAVLDWNLD